MSWDAAATLRALIPLLQGKPYHVALEPGRYIAGNAGILLTRVLYVKEGETKKFLILDAGMNDLIRPAMYDAHHDIVAVAEPSGPRVRYDVVGPVCESSDLFARDRDFSARGKPSET